MLKKISLLLIVIIICCICYYQYKKQVYPHRKPTPVLNKSAAALGISPKAEIKSTRVKKKLINIALFAVDRRTGDQVGNSDVIMVISINQMNGEVRMASIMRDTYVKIEGHGMDKINAAYAIGGPQLAIKTINQNFETDIRDYINVDFYEFARIIDAVGGIKIKVEQNEIPYLNKYLDEVVTYDKVPAVYVKTAGLQNLTGRQIVAYSRIRYVGNGDYERTERQRSVLITLSKKMQASKRKLIPLFFKDVLPNMETSLSTLSILMIASHLSYTHNKSIKQARFPLDVQGHGKKINNIWYLIADRKAVANSLSAFLNN
jgi:LCP family protein required for cell wall assembly